RATSLTQHDREQLTGVLAIALTVAEHLARLVRRVVVACPRGQVADVAPNPVGEGAGLLCWGLEVSRHVGHDLLDERGAFPAFGPQFSLPLADLGPRGERRTGDLQAQLFLRRPILIARQQFEVAGRPGVEPAIGAVADL